MNIRATRAWIFVCLPGIGYSTVTMFTYMFEVVMPSVCIRFIGAFCSSLSRQACDLCCRGGTAPMPVLIIQECWNRHMLLAIHSRSTRHQPRAAPAHTSPQPMRSPSPLSRVTFRQHKHPARSHRASLPRFERAHSGTHCDRARPSGGECECGGVGVGGGSWRAGVRAGEAAKAGDRESDRSGVQTRGPAGGVVGGGHAGRRANGHAAQRAISRAGGRASGRGVGWASGRVAYRQGSHPARSFRVRVPRFEPAPSLTSASGRSSGAGQECGVRAGDRAGRQAIVRAGKVARRAGGPTAYHGVLDAVVRGSNVVARASHGAAG